jgi:hypothetical protein
MELLGLGGPPPMELYVGKMTAAAKATIEPPEIGAIFDKPFGSKETRSGIALCEITCPVSDLPSGPGPYSFRISILDARRRLSVFEPSLPPIDPPPTMISSKIAVDKNVVDLSSWEEKRLGKPQ